MVEKEETIVAIATPPGRGAIGIIRVSGPQVKDIINGLDLPTLSPRMATLCNFRDTNYRIIDQGIAIFFPAPASFTGEDVLEIFTHGGRIVLELMVKNIIRLGARQARPGEFTEHAFLNNKIDLIQAESVAALIDAVSEQAARSAMRSLRGVFSSHIETLLQDLIKLRVYVESALDFPDEETEIYSEHNIREKLQQCVEDLESIMISAKRGAILKDGACAVIVGKPNAGKSTLLNILAGREAAIVTNVPGTTRDLVTQDILLDGIPLQVIDTAGLRDTVDQIEREGIRRAHGAIEQADIVLLIHEHGQQFSKDEEKLIKLASQEKNLIVLKNKIDLYQIQPDIHNISDTYSEISLSAKTGKGLELLISQLKKFLGMQDVHEDVFMARGRHLQALGRVAACLQHALENMKTRTGETGVELLAEDLRQAQCALGEITGEYVTEDLLGEIFSTFCIGK